MLNNTDSIDNLKKTIDATLFINDYLKDIKGLIKKDYQDKSLNDTYFDDMIKLYCIDYINKNNIKSFYVSMFDLTIKYNELNFKNYDLLHNDLIDFQRYLIETIETLKNNN